jgi:hypothetical protein
VSAPYGNGSPLVTSTVASGMGACASSVTRTLMRLAFGSTSFTSRAPPSITSWVEARA